MARLKLQERMKVPERYKSGVEALASLSGAERQELLQILRTVPPTLRHSDLSAAVSTRVKAIDASVVSELIDTLLSLYGVKTYLNEPTADIAEFITDSAEVKATDEQKEGLRQFLIEALNTDAIIVTSKAMDLFYEHEKSLHSARILTDVRPVFKDDAAQGPAASVVVHTLKLSYHVGSRIEEFFISLGPDDLSTLRDLLDRAETKARSIHSELKSANMLVLEPEER